MAFTGAVLTSSRPASADQIAAERAQAASITATIQATQAQIESLTGQVTAADYKLAQLATQIEASQRQISADHAVVSKDQRTLRVQAIADYTTSGTTNQVTEMFSTNVNTSGIRSEYSSIATGNVTTTVDNLQTAQSKLQETQNALKAQQTQATATRNSLQQSEDQASNLEARDKATLDSVNSTIQRLVTQQQEAEAAAAKAAATRAFEAKVAQAQQAQAAQAAAAAASAQAAVPSSGGGGGSVGYSAPAPAPPTVGGAAGAVQAAEGEVGVPYVWGGNTPAGFDCSGLVQWAYAQVGISLPHYSGAQYDDTTQIPLADIEPGDLLFYGPGGDEHVAMYVGGGSMIEAPYTGASVWITGVRTGGNFAGVGRVT
jgi:cell wall-associated NlpC family hydrolase